MNGSGRPTAASGGRFDLSPSAGRASVAPTSSEEDRIWSSRNGSVTRTERCVCGGLVIANPETPAYGVQAHNYTGRHRAWRANRDLGE